MPAPGPPGGRSTPRRQPLKDVVIASACRTPIGKFQGALSKFRAPDLGALVVREALSRAGVEPGAVDEVILGNVLQAGLGQNPARQAALGRAAFRTTVGSRHDQQGLRIRPEVGDARRPGDSAPVTPTVIVAGGMESHDRCALPHAAGPSGRAARPRVSCSTRWSMTACGTIYNDYHMGQTGENWSPRSYEISREDQDRLRGGEPQQAPRTPRAEGRFDEPRRMVVEVPQRQGRSDARSSTDENVRAGMTSPEGISQDAAGVQARRTARSPPRNASSQINDGAAALVVMSAEAAANELGVQAARAHRRTTPRGACAPEWVMMAPEQARSRRRLPRS